MLQFLKHIYFSNHWLFATLVHKIELFINFYRQNQTGLQVHSLLDWGVGALAQMLADLVLSYRCQIARVVFASFIFPLQHHHLIDHLSLNGRLTVYSRVRKSILLLWLRGCLKSNLVKEKFQMVGLIHLPLCLIYLSLHFGPLTSLVSVRWPSTVFVHQLY